MKIKVEPDESIQSSDQESVEYQRLILKILEDDKYFEDKTKEIREKYKIPLHGYKRTLKNIKKVKTIPEDDFLEEIFSLRDKYYFPAEWTISLFHYIPFNVFILSKVNEIEVIKENDLYKEKAVHGGKSASIFIKVNADLKFSELVKQLKKEFPKIQKFFEGDRFCEPIKKINLQNVDVYKKIYDLRVRKNKKFSFIAEELEKEDALCLSDSEVRTMFSRYKEAINFLKRK